MGCETEKTENGYRNRGQLAGLRTGTDVAAARTPCCMRDAGVWLSLSEDGYVQVMLYGVDLIYFF